MSVPCDDQGVSSLVARGAHLGRRSRGPLVLWSLASLWAFLIPLSGLRLGAAGALSDVVLFAGAGWFLLDALANRRLALSRDILVVAAILAAFAFIATMSSYNSQNLETSLRAVVTATGGFAASYFLLARLAEWPFALRQVMNAYVAGTVVLCVSLWILPNMLSGRKIGLAGHPVEIGGSVAIAFAFLLFLPHRGWKLGAIKLAALASLCSSFLAAESATGVVVILISALVTAVVRGTIKISQVLLSIGGLAAGYIYLSNSVTGSELITKISTAMDNTMFGYTGDVAALNTLQSRLLTMELGMERIYQDPVFGVGFDASNQVLGTLAPHNMLVNAWLSGGVIAFLLVAVILVWTLRTYGCIRKSRDALNWPFMAASVAAWAAAMSGPAFYNRPWLLAVFAFVVLGRKACSTEPAEEFHGEGTRPQRLSTKNSSSA